MERHSLCAGARRAPADGAVARVAAVGYEQHGLHRELALIECVLWAIDGLASPPARRARVWQHALCNSAHAVVGMDKRICGGVTLWQDAMGEWHPVRDPLPLLCASVSGHLYLASVRPPVSAARCSRCRARSTSCSFVS